MKDGDNSESKIGNRKLIYRQTERGWSIIVMPDKLQIDNFYHGVHTHPDRAKLKINDPEKLKNIIKMHIIAEGKINFPKLREMIL